MDWTAWAEVARLGLGSLPAFAAWRNSPAAAAWCLSDFISAAFRMGIRVLLHSKARVLFQSLGALLPGLHRSVGWGARLSRGEAVLTFGGAALEQLDCFEPSMYYHFTRVLGAWLDSQHAAAAWLAARTRCLTLFLFPLCWSLWLHRPLSGG